MDLGFAHGQAAHRALRVGVDVAELAALNAANVAHQDSEQLVSDFSVAFAIAFLISLYLSCYSNLYSGSLISCSRSFLYSASARTLS